MQHEQNNKANISSTSGPLKNMSRLKGGGGQTGSVALRDVTPVEFFKFVQLALPYLHNG